MQHSFPITPLGQALAYLWLACGAASFIAMLSIARAGDKPTPRRTRIAFAGFVAFMSPFAWLGVYMMIHMIALSESTTSGIAFGICFVGLAVAAYFAHKYHKGCCDCCGCILTSTQQFCKDGEGCKLITEN